VNFELEVQAYVFSVPDLGGRGYCPGIHIEKIEKGGIHIEREVTTQVVNDLFLVDLVHHTVVCKTRGLHDNICPGPPQA
jgi:hypothetical protein